MPRKLLNKYIPDHRKIRDHKHLRIFGSFLQSPALWHLNRHSVAKAFLVGLFCAWIPVPFQMVLAAGGAIIAQANIPVSVALVWLTNPITMPPLFYLAYKIGAFILNTPEQPFTMEPTWQWVHSEMMRIWEPFLLGCFVVGVICAIAGYISIQLAWRHSVVKRMRRRQARRACH